MRKKGLVAIAAAVMMAVSAFATPVFADTEAFDDYDHPRVVEDGKLTVGFVHSSPDFESIARCCQQAEIEAAHRGWDIVDVVYSTDTDLRDSILNLINQDVDAIVLFSLESMDSKADLVAQARQAGIGVYNLDNTIVDGSIGNVTMPNAVAASELIYKIGEDHGWTDNIGVITKRSIRVHIERTDPIKAICGVYDNMNILDEQDIQASSATPVQAATDYTKAWLTKYGDEMRADHLSESSVLEVRGLTKKFAGTIANNNINLTIGKKEIHALCGENGAGKSTFCKMLTGVYHPTSGEILMHGKKTNFQSPSDSMKAGIGMVYQERNLVGHLTGAQNVCLGYEPVKGGRVDEKEITAKAEEIRKKLGIDIPLDVPVDTLGAGAQQIIEIMRAFYNNPSVLILDEPTASLGEGEIRPFLDFVIDLRDQMGISVIFISHKIEEVFAIADYITVFTEGNSVLTSRTQDITQKECINAMMRADRIQEISATEKDFSKLPVLLSVKSVSYGGKKYNVPFEVHAGEAVGFYGLVGSGRTETMEALGGIRQADELDFTFNGETIHKTSSIEMVQKGYILTPEKRAFGAFKGLSLEDNICSLFLNRLSGKMGFFDHGRAKKFSLEVLKKNKVKYSNPGQNIAELSGGNIQKIIIGRSIEMENLKLLVLDEPTAGMDLGAKSEVYVKIRNIVDQEKQGVVFISSELDELITVCDKIYIFHEGNISGSFLRKEFVKAELLSAAVGQKVGVKNG